MELLKKTLFFITAFTPLWFILLINYSLTENPNFYLIVFSFCVLVSLIVILLSYLRKKRMCTKEGISSFKVIKKLEITHDVIFYILAYIPVLLINEFPVFIILLFTVYILYIKTNMLHVNPIIALQYRTYRIIDNNNNSVVVFSKLNLKTDDNFSQEIITNLYIVIDID